MIEERTPTNQGLYFFTLHLFFHTIFYLINYSLRDPITYAPDFLFSRLPHATPVRDSIRDYHSRFPFATHFRDYHSRLTFATHFRDYHSRLTFATPLATHIRDFTRDPHSRPTFTTHIHVTTPLTDGLC